MWQSGDSDQEVIVAGWVYSRCLTRTLFVRHPQLGLLAPGGRLHRGETQQADETRETEEETGLTSLRPAWDHPAALLGEKRPVGLAYAFVVHDSAPLVPEPGRLADWFSLADMLTDVFPLTEPVCTASPLRWAVPDATVHLTARTAADPGGSRRARTAIA